jgi:predicted N-formylglutamate amidohydrolase
MCPSVWIVLIILLIFVNSCCIRKFFSRLLFPCGEGFDASDVVQGSSRVYEVPHSYYPLQQPLPYGMRY